MAKTIVKLSGDQLLDAVIDYVVKHSIGPANTQKQMYRVDGEIDPRDCSMTLTFEKK